MTIAFWCVFVALLLPYILSVMARAGTPKGDYVGDPRGFNEGLTGWRRRANLAQQNAFEAFPAFAVAVVIAQIAGTPQGRLDVLAGAFILFRLFHGACYIADRAQLRSASWQGGMLCIIAIFVFAALAGGAPPGL
jgi:uncharacterized MAPEG superfamily protein